MRPRKRRQEVVQRVVVAHVDGSEPRADLVAIRLPVHQVVVAQFHIEKVTRLNALRVLVVVFGARRPDPDQS